FASLSYASMLGDVMPRKSSFLAFLLLTTVQTAVADDIKDCNQDDDLDLKLRACTAFIGSGQAQGKQLPAAYVHLGSANYSKGDYGRAIADYNKALRLDPQNIDAHTSKGQAYLAKGDLGAAFSSLGRAIKLRPDFAGAYMYRARAYLQAGKIDQ